VFENGSLKIIDRAKNIFKLSQGEYIAPEKLENIYILLPLIGQVMIYGDSLKNCVVAIVTLEEANVKKWAQNNGRPDDMSALVNDEQLKKEIMDSMIQTAKDNKFNALEKPGDIHMTADPFSIENDMLTPTFKLKRNVCKKVYQTEIDAMYAALTAKGK
jgi:long-chain acyl-CoA synthetase